MSGRVNIEHLRQHTDSARTYKWDVTITGGINGEIFNARCTTMAQPNPSYSPIEVSIRGFSKREYGAVEWNTISFNVIELQDYSLLKTLWDMGQQQFDSQTGVQANKASIELTVTMSLENLQDSPSKTWVLYGGVVNAISVPELGNDKAGINETSFEVAYDYAILQ